MIEVKGKKVTPKYTVGALEKFQEITGVDLLFEGGDLQDPLNRKALVYVGINAADPKIFKDFEDVDNMSPVEFVNAFGPCVDAFVKSLGGEPEKKEDAEPEKN